MLNRPRRQPPADFAQPCFTLVALALRANLDQLVTAEMDLDLPQNRFGKTFVADQHHGVQWMRFGAQGPALRRGQVFHEHSLGKPLS
jgi:hypothetical protein